MNTKMRSLRLLVLVGLLAALLMAFTAQAAPYAGPGGPGGGGGGGSSGGGGGSIGPLTDVEKAALNAAIQEEYLARNTYLAVMARLGPISPFYNIARSELAHANAVANLLTKYAMPIPANAGQTFGDLSTLATRQQACQIGVAVEVDDIDLYDYWLPRVDHGDIIQVFTNLQAASINNHLPAFQGCD